MMLTARIAASRFVGARPPRAHASAGWLPAMLRWRRRRVRRRPIAPINTATVTNNVWAPQLSFHIAGARLEAPARALAARITPIAPVRSMSGTVSHHWHRRALTMLAQHPGARAAARTATRPTVPAAGSRALSHPALLHRLPRGSAPATALVRRIHAARVTTTTRLTRRAATDRETAQGTARRRDRDRSTGFERVASPLRAGVKPAEPGESIAAAPRPHRAADIIWRTAAQRAVRSDSADTTRRPVETGSTPSHPSGHVPAASTSSPPLQSERRAALQISDLDPSLVDRLTDDVIRRVERRVRIERERRGL